MSTGAPDREKGRRVAEPSLVDAILPMGSLGALIGGSLALFGLDALDGPIQVALVICSAGAALIALNNGHTWDDVQRVGQSALSSIPARCSSCWRSVH